MGESQLPESFPGNEAPIQDVSPSEADSAPSSAKDVEPEKDLLSVVRDALQPQDAKPDPATAESSPGEEVAEEADEGEDAVADTSTDEDDHKDLPFGKHPRFKQLLRERAEFKTRAEEFDRIQDFMTRFKIEPQETANAFRILAMSKTDPAAALEELKALAHTLAVQAGEVLPPDLNEKVENGYLDREAAQELSKARVRAELERAKREELEQRYQSEAVDRQTTTIADAVAAWEEQTRRTDPDYGIKSDMVDDRVRAIVSERGKPKSVDEALAIANEAYETVSNRLRSVRQPKMPMRSAIGGKVSGSPTPEPKSVLDVIQQTMSRNRA